MALKDHAESEHFSESIAVATKNKIPIHSTEGGVRLATGLGWIWFVLFQFHPLPSSAWADGKLAEVAEQVGMYTDDK